VYFNPITQWITQWEILTNKNGMKNIENSLKKLDITMARKQIYIRT
jgi:hypothetical protein